MYCTTLLDDSRGTFWQHTKAKWEVSGCCHSLSCWADSISHPCSHQIKSTAQTLSQLYVLQPAVLIWYDHSPQSYNLYWKVFIIPSLSPLLIFIKLNSRLTRRIWGQQPTLHSKFYAVCEHTGYYEHKTLTWALLWSLSQIQWTAESTGDRNVERQQWNESTGCSNADKSRVC